MSLPRPFHLRLLNEFELRRFDGPLVLPAPAERLIAFLAVHRRPLSRRPVAEALWPDCDDRQAGARLRSTLWRLPGNDGQRLVEAGGGRLQISDQVTIDVRMLEDDDRFFELEVDQLTGDLLADWNVEWVQAERERVRQLRLHRLEQLSELALRDGRFAVALDAALSAVSADPLRESAHRRVMRVHLAEENPSEALRQFHTVRGLLREHLGLSPSHSTRSVVSHLLGRPLDHAS
jgi:DNA-binding SARP family transcriptional activator